MMARKRWGALVSMTDGGMGWYGLALPVFQFCMVPAVARCPSSITGGGGAEGAR
jgi:hypothetical protein